MCLTKQEVVEEDTTCSAVMTSKSGYGLTRNLIPPFPTVYSRLASNLYLLQPPRCWDWRHTPPSLGLLLLLPEENAAFSV